MAASDATTGGRRYKGQTVDERRTERRARLMAAALEVVGTRGWAEATMTEVCRVAGLTERYFYESFRTREALYAALVDDLDRELRESAFDAIAQQDLEPRARVAEAIGAIVALYVGDPRRGRALVEGIGVPEVEERRRRAVSGLFGLLAERWTLFFPDVDADEEQRRLRATAIGGATIALITGRLEGALTIADDALVRAIVSATMAIAAAPVAD